MLVLSSGCRPPSILIKNKFYFFIKIETYELDLNLYENQILTVGFCSPSFDNKSKDELVYV
jgi:hypothetical protein